MFDLGWTELLLIGIVALIVVGPEDLPTMFRAAGNFVGKAKRMAREFSQAMNEAADGAGVSDLKKSLDAATNPIKSAMKEVSKSTESFTAKTMAGPEHKLDPERAEMADKIRQRSAEVALERQAREEDEAARDAGKKASATPAPAPATGDAADDASASATSHDNAGDKR